MEKTGAIKPGVTPDTERKLTPGVKVAGDKAQTRALDDDPQKRLADAASAALRGK